MEILLSFVFVAITAVNGAEDQLYTIRNRKIDNLVVDGCDSIVRMQNYTQNPCHLWQKQSAPSNRVYFVNSKTGNVLVPRSLTNEAQVITQPYNGGANQRWNLYSDGSVINNAVNLALDIYQGYLKPNQPVIIYTVHRKQNQLWEIVPEPKSEPPTTQIPIPATQAPKLEPPTDTVICLAPQI